MEKDFSKHTVYGNFCSMDNRAFPIDCETLAALQSNAKKMAATALIAGCSRLILTGCKVSGSKRTEGYVFIVNADNPLTGEVIYHPEQTKADYCYIKEDPVLVEADGKKYPEAYDIRYIVDGRIDGAWAWSSFTNIADISNAALKEGLTNDMNSKDAALRTLIEQKEKSIYNTINTNGRNLNNKIIDAKSTLETLIDQKTTSSSVAFVRGMIMMWSGHCEDIPEGWVLCDGRTVNGFKVPDLRGRFVLASSECKINGLYDALFVQGGLGLPAHFADGAIQSTVTLQPRHIPSHRHTVSISDSDIVPLNRDGCLDGSQDSGDGSNTNKGRGAYWRGYQSNTKALSGYTGTAGEGAPFTVETLPPYYTLCFIVKI